MAKTHLQFGFVLLLTLTTTLIYAAVFLDVQQSIRLGANEPQIQIAQDLAAHLATGASPFATDATSAYVDIAHDQSTYTVVYDASGKPLSGTGYLDGSLATLPPGVFTDARAQGLDWLTWQPEQNVRQAIVVVPINNAQGGFVMAGRSLSYAEWQEEHLHIRVALEWSFTILALLIGYAVLRKTAVLV